MDTVNFVALDSCPVSSSSGAAYGTAKSSVVIFHSYVLRPERLMQNIICPIMAQILPIYGLVVAVIISGRLKGRAWLYTTASFSWLRGCASACAGLVAGFAIGVIGDSGVRASTQQPHLYVGMILILTFAEVSGLYGTIIGIMLVLNAVPDCTF